MNRILVIEDEEPMRRGLCTILRLEGYDVANADNGEDGLRLAQQQPPDLILCDVAMPRLDGHGVLTALRTDASTSGIPFLFLTAKGEHADIRAGMNLGADDYLTKPVSRDDLIRAVTARLQRQHQQALAARQGITLKPDFSSATPLQALGLTPREATVLLWVAQGKSNPEIAMILGSGEGTIRKHLEHVFAKLGVESRAAAASRALEVLMRA
jgi:DNA-binding NarL/FixJ family response regulator